MKGDFQPLHQSYHHGSNPYHEIHRGDNGPRQDTLGACLEIVEPHNRLLTSPSTRSRTGSSVYGRTTGMISASAVVSQAEKETRVKWRSGGGGGEEGVS